MGKEKVAAGYLQEAYYCYAKWGAKAKTEDLETRYPNLLRPILQSAESAVNVFETLLSIIAPYGSIHASTNSSRSLSTSANKLLDVVTILKASQSLSGTLQLNELLHRLTQIILQHSGGDRCALLLPNSSGAWHVEAIATPEAIALSSEPLEGNTHVPVKLIQYAKNIQAVVVFDNCQTDLPVMGQYLSQQQPKSVMCLPILNQAQSIGILYYEHTHESSHCELLLKDGRTIERTSVPVNFAGQEDWGRIWYFRDISDRKASETLIQAKNDALQQALTQLQKSQAQVVQSEKMSALGNLVAGVAHEINNPIGFLNGSLTNAKDYVQDLLRYLALYQQHHPNPAAAVQGCAADIDLEFLFVIMGRECLRM